MRLPILWALVLLAASSPMRVPAAVVPAGEPPRPAGEAVDVVFTEVSVYSLPHIVVDHEFAVGDGQVVAVDRPDPVLRFQYKTVDHSHGTSVDAHIDFKVYEDRDFPRGTRPRWVLAHEINHVASNVSPDQRRVAEKTFRSMGVKTVQLDLSPSRPVQRIKVEAHGKIYLPQTSVVIRKPLDTHDRTATRTFLVVLHPRWGDAQHRSRALEDTLGLLSELKTELWAWRGHLTRISVAARSVGELATVTGPGVVGILERPGPVLHQDPERAGAALVEEASRVAGRPPPPRTEAQGPVVTRPPTSPQVLRADLRAPTLAAALRAGSGGHLALVAARISERQSLRTRIERLVDAIELALGSMVYLWWVDGVGALERPLGRLAKAVGEATESARELEAAVGGEVGRDGASGAWGPIEASAVYREATSGTAFQDRRAAAQALRGVLADLAVLSGEAHHRLSVLARAAARARDTVATSPRRFDELITAPDEDSAGLALSVSARSVDVRPGGGTSLGLSVTNTSGRPRELVIAEAWTPPRGFKTGLTEARVSLAPGASRTVGYSIAAPYYLHEPANHVAVLTVGEPAPGRSVAVSVLVRLVVGGVALEPPPPEGPLPGEGRLWVSTDHAGHIDLAPGSVGKVHLVVRHLGPARRTVLARLLTPVPQRWIAQVEPEEIELTPGEPRRVTLTVSAPAYVADEREVDLLIGIGWSDEFERPGRLTYRKVVARLTTQRPRPLVNGGEVRTYYARTGAPTTLFVEVANAGSADDTFDILVEERPRGWYVHLDRTTVRLPARRSPALVGLTVRPPLDASTGEFERLVVRAVSVRHPHITTAQAITVAVRSDLEMALVAEREQYLVSPGTEGVVRFTAHNVLERPITWTFRVSPATSHPEWFTVDAPLSRIDPHQERVVEVRVRLPANVPVDRTFPLALMALDEHGGEITSAVARLRVIPRHRVLMNAITEEIVRTPTLLILPLRVQNGGSVPDRVALHVTGRRRYWARLSHRIVSLNPGGEIVVRLTVRVPPEARFGQSADIAVRAQSLKDASAAAQVGVGASPKRTRRVNTSTAHGQVRF